MRSKVRSLVLPVLVVGLVSAECFARISVKTILDAGGQWEATGFGITNRIDASPGFGVAGELTLLSLSRIESGVGVEYGSYRDLEVPHLDASFAFIPFYGYAKLFAGPDSSSVFLTGRFGYNLHRGDEGYTPGIDLHGGDYVAFGLGYSFGKAGKRGQVELTYSTNNGTREMMGLSVDVKYTRLSMGYVRSF